MATKRQKSTNKNRAGKEKTPYSILRNPFLWIVMGLFVTIGVYVITSKPQKKALQPKTAQNSISPMQARVKQPRVKTQHASIVKKTESKKQADLSKKEAKIALNMKNRRSVTPKGDFMAPKWSPDGLDILATKGKYKGKPYQQPRSDRAASQYDC